MALTREQLGKRLLALISRGVELPSSMEEPQAQESNIPSRLCATCASDDKGRSKAKNTVKN